MSGTWPGPDGGLGIRSSITFNKSWTTSWKGHVWQSSKTLEKESWVWKMAFLQTSRNSSKGQGDTRIEALFHVNQSLWRKHIHRLIWFSGAALRPLCRCCHFKTRLHERSVPRQSQLPSETTSQLSCNSISEKFGTFYMDSNATLHRLTIVSNIFIFSRETDL